MVKQTVEKLDYHRNGICGLGFWVGIVREVEAGAPERRMLVVRFSEEADKATGNVVCAAFDLAKLAEGVIEFFENSWRGDHYHEVMDQAIAARQKERGW